LGQACVAAAREQVDNPKFWKLIADRCVQLGADLEPQDISLLLNALSRTRRLSNHFPAIEALSSTILRKLSYFSSVQLAMTLSALGKSFSQTALPPDLVTGLIQEVKWRVHEFNTSVEFSMLVNALVKLGVADQGLFTRLAGIFQSKIRTGAMSIPIRDLSVVASAFSSAGIRDITLYQMVCERAVPVLSEATTIEIARLLTSIARAGLDVGELAKVANGTCREKFRSLTSMDIVNTVFAFGGLCESIHIEDCPNISSLLQLVKTSFLASIPLMPIKDVAAVLLSFSRWRINLTESELQVLLRTVGPMIRRRSDDADDDVVIAAAAVNCLSAGMSDGTKAIVCAFIEPILEVIVSTVRSSSTLEFQQIVRVVNACNAHNLTTDNLINAVASAVATRHTSLDMHAKSLLHSSLSAKLPKDHDLIIVLRGDS